MIDRKHQAIHPTKMLINALKEQWENTLPVLLMATVLCVAIVMALRLPIYPDEVAYRILLEKFFQSGGVKSSITPYCLEGFQVAPPHLLKFSAVVWSILSQINSSIAYRIIPISLLLISLCSLYWLARRHDMRAKPWFLFLFIPGVSVYGLVIIRPEIFIASSLVILAIWGLHVAKSEKLRPNELIYISIGISVNFILVSYVHPKALYLLLPTLIILGLIIERVLRKPISTAFMVVLIGSVLLTAYDAVEMHRLGYASCKDFPTIQTSMNSLNVNIMDLFGNMPKFITNISMANDNVRFDRTLSQLGYKSNYDIGVLPNVPNIWVMNFMIQLIVLATFLYTSIVLTLNIIASLRNRKIEREFLVYGGLTATVACQFFFNIPKNWYDISLTVFSLGVLAYLGSGLKSSKADTFPASFIDKMAQRLQSVIAISALLSLGINYQYIYRQFVDGYLGPGISIQTPLDKLQVLAKSQFPLDYENISKPIIVDDLTYHMFQKHAKIYPVTYLMLNAKNDPKTIDVTLAGQNVTGITRCSSLIEFDIFTERNTTLLDRIAFISAPNTNVDICKWEVH